jgi:hypothetical protein
MSKHAYSHHHDDEEEKYFNTDPANEKAQDEDLLDQYMELVNKELKANNLPITIAPNTNPCQLVLILLGPIR